MMQTNVFNPLVSVIIPVYNGSNFLAIAINSVLNQTYSNIELLIVNDGSNDDGKTERIALSFKSDRIKIRYFYQENGGVASALNKGINECSGEYICWLSHDDAFPKDRIEKQVNFLAKQTEDREHAIPYTKTKLIDERGKRKGLVSQLVFVGSKRTFSKPSDLFAMKHIVYCSLLVPTSFFKHNPFVENLRYSQDFFSYFQILTHGYRLVYCSKSFNLYRVHAEQGSFLRTDEYASDCAEIHRTFIDYFEKTDDISFLTKYLFWLAKKSSISSVHEINFQQTITEYSAVFSKKTKKIALIIRKVCHPLYKIKKVLFGR